ncbi:MAG: YqaE/Pmp3 family membrane protein [Bacteroidota bacterium]
MKTIRDIILSTCFLLVLSGGFTWAVNPGSGAGGDTRDTRDHQAAERAQAAPAALSVQEALAGEEAALAAPTETIAPAKKNRAMKMHLRTSKRQSMLAPQEAESAAKNKIDLQEELMREAELARLSLTDVQRAADQILLRLTTVDRTEMPVSDTAVAIFLLLLFVVPPTAVFASTREFKTEFWFNVVLTCLFWLPGMIHAGLMIERKSGPEQD